jgi:hypothetical protein
MGRRPVGISRQPVYLLPDWIDSTAERARAAVGARDFPPHVRLLWWPRRQLPTSRLVADLSYVLDEITDVMLCRAEKRYVNFIHGRYSESSGPGTAENLGLAGLVVRQVAFL